MEATKQAPGWWIAVYLTENKVSYTDRTGFVSYTSGHDGSLIQWVEATYPLSGGRYARKGYQGHRTMHAALADLAKWEQTGFRATAEGAE